MKILILLLGTAISVDFNTMLTIAGLIFTVGSAYQILKESGRKILKMEENVENKFTRKEDHARSVQDIADLKKDYATMSAQIVHLSVMLAEVNAGVKMLLDKQK